MKNNILYITYNNFPPLIKKKFSLKFNEKFSNNFIWDPKIIKKKYKSLYWTVADYTKFFKKKNKNYKKLIIKNKKRVQFPQGWLKNGCMAWHPRIIYHSLIDLCKPNDILVYHDINFDKYPIYLKNFNFDRNFYSKIISNHSVVLFRDSYQPLKAQCKNLLLQRFNLQKYKNLNGFWLGFIVVKNDSKGRRFIKKWCKLSTINNLGPLPDTRESDHDFVYNTATQSTLSILYYKEKKMREYIKVVYTPFRQIFKFNFFYLRNIKAFLIIKYLELINMRL